MRTNAVLELQTILGSDTGADDPVGVALREAIADGAFRGEKKVSNWKLGAEQEPGLISE